MSNMVDKHTTVEHVDVIDVQHITVDTGTLRSHNISGLLQGIFAIRSFVSLIYLGAALPSESL
jgi:hypothetical protein